MQACRQRLIAGDHALPEPDDGNKDGEFVLAQRQFFGDQFFGVIRLYGRYCFTQQLQRVQTFQAAHRVTVEFIQLQSQHTVRLMQVGELQLPQPLCAGGGIFECRVGVVVGGIQRQGQHS